MEEQIKTNREIQREMYEMIHEVHAEVMGNEDAGRLSYGKRISKLENADKKRTGIYILISAMSSGIAIVIKYFYELFNSH